MDAIRIAVIGTGGMANGHVRSFNAMDGVSVVAACDLDGKRLAAFADLHGIEARHTDYRDLLKSEDVDAVTVVTSDKAHCDISCAALKRRRHVLCEKPMATSVAQAKRMARAAEKAGTINMINFSHRTNPGVDKARELVQQGALGEVRHVEASYLQSWLVQDGWGDWRNKPAFQWRMSKAHGGGTLGDIGCHIIDLTTYVAGDVNRLAAQLKSYPKGVRGNRWKGYTLDADDSVFMQVEFANSALGVIHASRWASGHSNVLRLRVYGTEGALDFDTERGGDRLRVCIGDFAVRHQLWSDLEVGTPRRSIYERFVSGIRTGVQEAPTFADGLRVQRCLEACHTSDSAGRRVALNT